MAKKAKKKHHTTRRRRVGAKSDLPNVILRVIGLVAGGAATAFGVQAVNTALGVGVAGNTTPLWVAPVGAAATGAVIPHLVKGEGPMQSLATGFGNGMVAVGGVMALNQTLISVPGISGLAMSSNASPTTNVLRKAVSGGPNAYLNRTVGKMHKVSGAMGALVSD